MGDNVGDRVDEQSVYQQVRWSVYDPNGITFMAFNLLINSHPKIMRAMMRAVI